jgi:hypothetical protein
MSRPRGGAGTTRTEPPVSGSVLAVLLEEGVRGNEPPPGLEPDRCDGHWSTDHGSQNPLCLVPRHLPRQGPVERKTCVPPSAHWTGEVPSLRGGEGKRTLQQPTQWTPVHEDRSLANRQKTARTKRATRMLDPVGIRSGGVPVPARDTIERSLLRDLNPGPPPYHGGALPLS